MYNLPFTRFILALLISISASFCLTAQVLHRDTIPPQKQVEVIHFGADEGNDAEKNSTLRRGIVKIAPLSFVLGYFPVFYEYEIKDWLSLQGGVGLTFKPPVSDLQTQIFDELNSDCTDCDNYRDYSYRKGGIGYLLALSPRLYFSSDGMDGSYIAPEVRLYQRNSQAQKPDRSSTFDLVRLPNDYDDEHLRFTDLMVNFGWQALYPKLAIDWSVGLGMRRCERRMAIDRYG